MPATDAVAAAGENGSCRMLRFCANLSTLFCEHPPLARPAAAGAAGFDAVEIQFPYDAPAQQWADAIQTAGVALALFNLPAGDLVEGGPGLACVPGRQALFRAAVEDAAGYARVLRPHCVNVLAGSIPAGSMREDCLATLAENLHFAAERMARIGVGVVLEAVNTVDRPGYAIARTHEALDAIDRACHPNLRIQYDIYHMHAMEGNVAATLARVHPRIGHLQFADHPGRHEPGTGEIDFDAVFAAIAALPYRGFVGAEYLPSRRTEDTLGWLGRARRLLRSSPQSETQPRANAEGRP